jgi:hypothetical protein
VFDLGPARAASQDDFGAMADQHHGETLPRIQPYVAPDQEPPRGFDVCRLLARVFLGSSPRRLASTLLLSLQGTLELLARGSRSASRPHQMMNRSTGWDGSVCATVTASDSQRNTVNGQSMKTTWKCDRIAEILAGPRCANCRPSVSTSVLSSRSGETVGAASLMAGRN